MIPAAIRPMAATARAAASVDRSGTAAATARCDSLTAGMRELLSAQAGSSRRAVGAGRDEAGGVPVARETAGARERFKSGHEELPSVVEHVPVLRPGNVRLTGCTGELTWRPGADEREGR